MKVVDMAGKVFGRVTVLSRDPRKRGKAYWLCQCDCGRKKSVSGDSLRRGATRSCGCGVAETARRIKQSENLIHGHSKRAALSRTYVTWKTMRNRCNGRDPRRIFYYSGRGITVCARWDSFENFLADMGNRPEGKTLDRIDVNGNYEPSNCRWATPAEQSRNRRKPEVRNAAQ